MKEEYFEHLLDRYFDRSLDEEGLTELEWLLRCSREKRIEFWRRAHLNEALRKHYREARGARWPLRKEAKDSPPLIGRKIWIAGALAVAAAVVLALLPRDHRPRDLAPEGVVAVLGRNTEMVWANSLNLREGEQLPPGDYRLIRGVATIEFPKGVRVIAMGLVSFTLGSDADIRITSGHVRVEVPVEARGFGIACNAGDLRAEGGTYDLKISPEQEIELMVEAGSIDVPGTKTRLVVTAPEFVRYEASGRMEMRASVAGQDVRASDAVSRSKPSRLPEWRVASRKRAEDPALLVHFRMDSANEKIRERLRNSSRNPAAGSEAIVFAAEEVEGRWPGKRGLGFFNSSALARIPIEGQFPKVTYAAWIRIGQLQSLYNAMFMSESDVPGEAHWQLSPAAEFYFSVRPEQMNLGSLFHRCYGGSISDPRQKGVWKHVATTYDSESRQGILYVDGKEFHRASFPEAIPLQFGNATLGNVMEPDNPRSRSRRFGGVIDEFLLYSRVLAPEEIEALYEEGRPD